MRVFFILLTFFSSIVAYVPPGGIQTAPRTKTVERRTSALFWQHQHFEKIRGGGTGEKLDTLRRNAAKELGGTALLVALGSSINRAAGQDTPLPIIAAFWGAAVFFCIKTVGGDAHFNPAVTLAEYFGGDRKYSDVKKLVVYCLSQVMGGALGGLFFMVFNGSTNPVGPLVSTFTRFQPAFFAELIGTTMIAFAAFNKNLSSSPEKPKIVAMAVAFGIIIAGSISQAGLNPARELGPRIAAIILGKVNWTFLSGDKLIVYILAPCIGAIFGKLLGGK